MTMWRREQIIAGVISKKRSSVQGRGWSRGGLGSDRHPDGPFILRGRKEECKSLNTRG